MRQCNAFLASVFYMLVSVSSFAEPCAYSGAFELTSINMKPVSYALEPKIALENFVKDPKNPVLQIITKNESYLKEEAKNSVVSKYVLDRMSQIVNLWLEVRPKKSSTWLDKQGTWLEKHPEVVFEIDRRLYEKLVDVLSFLVTEVGRKKHSIEETQEHVEAILDSIFGELKDKEGAMTTHAYLLRLIHHSSTDSRSTFFKATREMDARLLKAKTEEMSFSRDDMEIAFRMLIDRN